MNTETLTQALGQEWDQPDGFLGQLRMRVFDSEAYERFFHLLQSINFDDQTSIDKGLVSLLWFVPTFMMWQSESLREAGFDMIQYGNAIEKITNELYRVLGVP